MAAMYLWAFVVFASCFFGASADSVIKDPVAFKNATWAKCQKQENVPDDVMEDFYFFTSTDRIKDYKCVVKCVQDEYGMYNEDRTVNMDLVGKVIKSLWKEQLHQKIFAIIEECKNSDPQGTHKCQRNFDILDCFIKSAKKGNIDISNKKN